METRNKRGGALLVGSLMLATGGIMLLHELNLFHIGRAWRLWPVYMIIVGLWSLFTCRRGRVFSGLLVTGMGVLFLAINFHLWGLRMSYFAPIVVLITGVSFVIDALLARRDPPDDGVPTGGIQ